MTQNEKDLLLKDLSSRLPYGVKISVDDRIETLQGINTSDNVIEYGSFLSSDIEEVRPYLFPISSMTGEQKEEYEKIIYRGIELHSERYYDVIDIDSFEDLEKFYNKNHLDFRGLIRMGIAINAVGLNIY